MTELLLPQQHSCTPPWWQVRSKASNFKFTLKYLALSQEERAATLTDARLDFNAQVRS